MHPYVAEQFSDEEAAVLRRYVTNLDQPVFALVNLPEVVKGALFARYSRSPKSLRRLFLDEFVGDLDVSGDVTFDATIGLKRAEELYERVFFEYGDDSVAQLGGVHLACEQSSNLLTKVLEWGRLMSYLEQSTRYLAYDQRLTSGHYRYFRPPAVLDSPLGARYVGDLDRMFDTYGELLGAMQSYLHAAHPKDPGDSDFVHRQAVKAKALDAVRGVLPAASLSNVGVFGTGQGYEQLLLRMRSHPLQEAREYAELMLVELRKVIPSFLRRVDVADRGVAWSEYLESTREGTARVVERLFPGGLGEEAEAPEVRLLDFDPDGEDKVLAAACFSHMSGSEAAVLAAVRALSAPERAVLLESYVGDRRNRRHRPGRALERTDYRFELVTDYGAFRDLQRHRLCTIEWQPLTCSLGADVPSTIVDAGLADRFAETLARSSDLHDELARTVPDDAGYAVALAYRVRYVMQMNAREAMHVLELRSGPQGHPAYRRVAQEMHRQIASVAGHAAIASAMSHVDYDGADLERLDTERRAEAKRLERAHGA